jgi:hypothetical protein
LTSSSCPEQKVVAKIGTVFLHIFAVKFQFQTKKNLNITFYFEGGSNAFITKIANV